MIEFDTLIPTLLNRYSRIYFQSCDKNYRVTIDSEQSFHLINRNDNTFLDYYNDSDSTILELKYSDECDDEAHHISSKFPFRLTKSSKYVSGLQKIFGEFD